jgi:threonine/homoserine/homoserine lactone efflux protein
MTGELVLLWMTALPLMGSPGPATLSNAAAGAAFGWAGGLRYMLGVSAGTSTVLLLIATGVTGAVLAVPRAAFVITVAGALYILYLAYRIATAPPVAKGDGSVPAPSFAGGYLLAIANPKAYAALGAVFASRTVVPDDVLFDAGIKIAALVPLVLAVNSVWLVLGSAFAVVLTHPSASRVANVSFAVLLVASVAMVFW